MSTLKIPLKTCLCSLFPIHLLSSTLEPTMLKVLSPTAKQMTFTLWNPKLEFSVLDPIDSISHCWALPFFLTYPLHLASRTTYLSNISPTLVLSFPLPEFHKVSMPVDLILVHLFSIFSYSIDDLIQFHDCTMKWCLLNYTLKDFPLEHRPSHPTTSGHFCLNI